MTMENIEHWSETILTPTMRKLVADAEKRSDERQSPDLEATELAYELWRTALQWRSVVVELTAALDFPDIGEFLEAADLPGCDECGGILPIGVDKGLCGACGCGRCGGHVDFTGYGLHLACPRCDTVLLADNPRAGRPGWDGRTAEAAEYSRPKAA